MKVQDIQVNQIGTPVAPAKGSIVVSLLMRTVLFFIFGGVMVAIFAIAGSEHPLGEAEKWWPFQAILANVATFFILRRLVHRSGGSYRELLNIRKERIGKDLKQFLWLVVVGFVLGGIPLYLSSYVILGSFTPPDTMFQPLPVWAAVLAVLLFPITNAAVETPTYIGYAMPRIRERTGKLWLAATLAGLALALQHIALPIVLDPPYLLWRFVGFIPLAIVLGLIFTRTKRLFPIMLAHGIMDLQMVLFVLLGSI